MRARVGTSGFAYAHWRGRFYPEGLRERAWLGYYARHFDTVELNRTFYRWPGTETFAHWQQAVPEDFVFAVKAPRVVTHYHRLADVDEAVSLLAATRALGAKRGPVLFQLPPRFKADPARLAALLEALPADLAAAFEFRDPSWHDAAIFRLLERHDAAFCIFDLGGVTSPRRRTASFVYVRLHGPEVRYGGRYGRARLESWASWLVRENPAVAYVYFDNDEAAYAVEDARLMRELLADRGALP